MSALHIEKSGTRTFCGRRMANKDRITVKGDPLSYWRACDVMHRYGCYTCSDALWAAQGGSPLARGLRAALAAGRSGG